VAFDAGNLKPVVEAIRQKIPKAWSRHHARKLLERAERKAKLPVGEGSDFHAYRRKWATERKHLPAQDVADAGGWKDLAMLQTAYTQPDDLTVLAVVAEPTKLRDAKPKTDTARAIFRVFASPRCIDVARVEGQEKRPRSQVQTWPVLLYGRGDWI